MDERVQAALDRLTDARKVRAAAGEAYASANNALLRARGAEAQAEMLLSRACYEVAGVNWVVIPPAEDVR